MSTISITPFLWFDNNASDAIERYLTVFPDSELVNENRMPDGSIFIATLRLQGQEIMLLNGGPAHPHTEAFSLSVGVETQEEVDSISEALIDGGGEQGPCGWLTDAFGLSWQVVPALLGQLMSDPDPEKVGRVGTALRQMTRLNLQGLQDAYDGKG
ncbi:VOC family protein [Aeromicrobium sp.]|uniref:VOC family protein n=1 Tax=Aeromicrobium sp. TaxID=1871063 RepID=UPI0019A5A874|nr:VOC family protein [Aeromicrobium sp.]MBC7630106.1 VOC family protein [Aeromicrobium sp.]